MSSSHVFQNLSASLSNFSVGNYNDVYKLVFAGGIAASASRQFHERYNPQARLSEIATMQFVRASGLYPDIVVPQAHTWDVAFTNLVGAPIRASAMVRRYYLRQHFSACFAQEYHDRYGDYNLGRTMLFAHAPY